MAEVNCLSQHLCSPREGHLNYICKVFRYLHNNLSKNQERIAFDPACVKKGEKLFEIYTGELEYWKEFYPDTAEAHPRKKLEPLVETITVPVYVDKNHAGNLANRRSHSGILIYTNSSLINFYIKKHNTV